jgi:hypothetical protein
MGLNTKYAKEIHEETGYFATWLPTANVQIGDVGTVKDGVFQKKGTLKDFGIACSSEVDPQTGDIAYASANAVSIDFKAAGNAPVPGGPAGTVDADASVAISFSRADAVLFQAAGVKTLTISSLSQISDDILSRYKAGKWPSDYIVVTDVVSAAGVTVLISSGKDAHIDLSAKGSLGTGQAKLASADATFAINKSSSIGTQIVGAKDSTPLFKASGINTSWWHGPIVAQKAGADGVKIVPLEYVDFVGPPAERGG